MPEYSKGFGSKYDSLSDDLKSVCDALLAEIDKHFDPASRGDARFANNQYRVWKQPYNKNFLIVEPKPGKSLISVHIHAFKKTLDNIPCSRNLSITEKPHSDPKRKEAGPPVQFIDLKRHSEISCVIEYAKAAQERWGRGLREI